MDPGRPVSRLLQRSMGELMAVQSRVIVVEMERGLPSLIPQVSFLHMRYFLLSLVTGFHV